MVAMVAIPTSALALTVQNAHNGSSISKPIVQNRIEPTATTKKPKKKNAFIVYSFYSSIYQRVINTSCWDICGWGAGGRCGCMCTFTAPTIRRNVSSLNNAFIARIDCLYLTTNRLRVFYIHLNVIFFCTVSPIPCPPKYIQLCPCYCAPSIYISHMQFEYDAIAKYKVPHSGNEFCVRSVERRINMEISSVPAKKNNRKKNPMSNPSKRFTIIFYIHWSVCTLVLITLLS